MRKLAAPWAAIGLAALLYGVGAWAANPAHAADLTADDIASLKATRTGDMTKLVVHDAPRDRVDRAFKDKDGTEHTLAEYTGRIVVLNFWATWCPPCRAEMPSIDRLAADVAGQDIAVVALSTDRFGIERVGRFFEEIGIRTLTLYQDKGGRLAREAAVIGLPVTLILDRQGREIARLQGEAEWDGPAARAILTRLVEMTGPPS